MKNVKMLKSGLGPELQTVDGARADYWKLVGACEILGEGEADQNKDLNLAGELGPGIITEAAEENPIDDFSDQHDDLMGLDTEEAKEGSEGPDFTIAEGLMERPQLTIDEVNKMNRGKLDQIAPKFGLTTSDYANVNLLREAFIAELPK